MNIVQTSCPKQKRRLARHGRALLALVVTAACLRAYAAPRRQDAQQDSAPAPARRQGLANAPWPKFHGDTRSTGMGGCATDNARPWKAALLTRSASGPPALGADGTVFVTARNLTALDGASGRKKWSFPEAETNIGGAVVDAGNTVYICGAAGDLSSDKYNIYALDANTGKVRWRFPVAHNTTNSPALGANGLLYVQSYDGNLYAIDARTGKQKWMFALPEPIFTSPEAFHSILPAILCSPSIGADGTVYTSHDRLYAIDGDTGKQKWVSGGVGAETGETPVIGPDGTLYLGVGNQPRSGTIIALDGATGQRKWSFAVQGNPYYTPLALDSDGTLYVGTYDGGLYALNSSGGTLKWHFAAPGTIGAAPAIGADHTVYFGCGDGKFYALDGATGKTKWATPLESVPIMSPALGANGLVYTASRAGIVYALRASDGAKPRPVAQ